MPPPNNSVTIRVGTAIILALFAMWWSVAFNSLSCFPPFFFFLLLFVGRVGANFFFFLSLPRSPTVLGCIHINVSSAFFLPPPFIYLPFPSFVFSAFFPYSSL
jgi:hypothetical protein